MSVGELKREEDRPAMVRFETRAVEDKVASRESGGVIYKDVDWVMVTPPYSKDCFESKAKTWFETVEKNVRNGRTPPEWRDHWKKTYENWKKGEEAPINGTSVKNWSAITKAQCKTLLIANIFTIEDLAIANDEGVRRLGMGGVDLKNKARAYVQATKDTGPLVMENAALKKQVDQQEVTISNLTEKIEIMGQRLEAMQSQPLQEVEISASDILDVEGPEMVTPPVDIPPIPKISIQDQYIAKFGKKPHHLMKEATILRKLAE